MVSPQLQRVVVVIGFAGLVGFAVAGVAYRHRESPSARSFALLSAVTAVWALLTVPYLLARNPETVETLYLSTLVVSMNIPLLWLVFTVRHAGWERLLTTGRLVALWLPLAALPVVRLTAPLHGLELATATVQTVNGITAPVGPRDWLYLVGAVVGYGYTVAGFLVLVVSALSAHRVKRLQTAAIITGAVFPTFGSVAYAIGFSPHPGVSLGPAMFAVFAVVTTLALFRFDFSSISPMAGNVLVDQLSEPVVILDDDDEVVDHNDAAVRLSADSEIVGRHVDDLVEGLADRAESADTITVDLPDEGMSVFEVEAFDVEDRFEMPRGRLVLLRDVSDQQRRLEQLQAMQAATQEFISARTAPEVAEIAVGFASDALENPLAAVLLEDEDGELRASAATDAFADAFGDDATVVPGSGPAWRAFVNSEVTPVDCRDVGFGDSERVPDQGLLLVPLGDHGLLAVGTDSAGSYSPVERQLGRILAGTIETALTRVAHERRLRESRTALERRTEQIEFFNGVLRHNIRNSMMVIDGHVQFLEAHVDDNQEKIRTVREWCDELTVLTEKIRAITDTVTASESERLTDVDLSAELHEQAQRIREEFDAEVSVDVDDELYVAANDLLADVIESVMTNAVEHNDADEPRITVTGDVLGEWVQVKLADNGPGLSEELKTKVFQREVGTDQTSSGFGLYFVSVMMDLYEGNVWFEDNDPRGTVVVLEFRLPRDHQETAEV